MKIVLSLFVLLATMYMVCAKGYGDETDALYSYQERLNHDMTNAARVAPLNYRSSIYADYYTPTLTGVINANTYPAVSPVWYHTELNAAARYHSKDMGDKKYFAHNSQDGTTWSARIKKYHTCGGISENIAAGQKNGLDVNNAWLCDKSGSTCCTDGESCDGHRKNIMRSSSKSVGHGYYKCTSSCTYSAYYTQDFSTCTPYSQTNQSIYSATHFVNEDVKVATNTRVRFMLTHADEAANSVSAKVFIWGEGVTKTNYTLEREFGTVKSGHYMYEADWTTNANNCLTYYFEVTTNSGAKKTRYPATSNLYTTGLGTCEKVSTYTPPKDDDDDDDNTDNKDKNGASSLSISITLLALIIAILF